MNQSFKTIIIGLAVLAIAATAGGQANPLAQRFKQLDKNNDGKIQPEETQWPDWIRGIDTNGDGGASLEELTAGTEEFNRRKNMVDASQGTSTGAPPDFSGRWVLESATGDGADRITAAESGVVYRITQDHSRIAFRRGDAGQTVAYPLDGAESLATFPGGGRVRVSGRWLDDGMTLEMKTVKIGDNETPAATIIERQSFSADRRNIVLHRTVESPQGRQVHTLIYRLAENAPAD